MSILGIETQDVISDTPVVGKDRIAWWLTGFSDAEGTFCITRYIGKCRKDGSRCPSGYTFEFSIQVRDDDLSALEQINDYFKAGTIIYAKRTGRNKNQVSFKIRDFDSIINIIIPHFDKYPLLTKKHKDYLLFREAALIHHDYFKNGSHNKWGTSHANTIEDYRIRLNSGRMDFFNAGIVYKSQELDSVTNSQFNAWLPGFVDGDGCFGAYLGKGENPSIGFKFIIQLREDDREILEFIKNKIGYGNIRYKKRTKCSTKNAKSCMAFEITSAEDCYNSIIPLFRSNILRAKKHRDFLLFDLGISRLIDSQKLRKNKFCENTTDECKEIRKSVIHTVNNLKQTKEYRL